MSKYFADLLDVDEPLFSSSLNQLEKATTTPGIDVRLKGQIIEKFNRKLKQLGLDPKDSTGEEVYTAVTNKVKEHDKLLSKTVGATGNESVEELTQLVVKCLEKANDKQGCWALKDTAMKRMLRAKPPKNVMKILGHKKVSELLKNEDLNEVCGAIRFAESDDWLTEFNQQYEKLTIKDFVRRDVQVVVMSKEKWGELAANYIKQRRQLVTQLKEMGLIVVMPSALPSIPGLTTQLLLFLIHYMNEINIYSSFFQLQKDKPNFGSLIASTLNHDPDDHVAISGVNIHWRIVHRHISASDKASEQKELLRPHLDEEDLQWRKVEEVLYELNPELAFWQDLDYVGALYEGQPVSLNLLDATLNYSNSLSYDDRLTRHFRDALWNELFSRYMGQKVLENQVFKQLDIN